MSQVDFDRRVISLYNGAHRASY